MNKILTSLGNGFAFCILFLVADGLSAQDWPALRGENGEGVVRTNGILSKTSDVQLKVRWKIKLGSGYSSVVVADKKVIAIYSGHKETAGEQAAEGVAKQDWMVALQAEDGKRIWHYSLGPTFIGKNGSFDGALATPVVHKQKVYGLSATGKLFCVNLKDGKEIWTRDLQKEFKSPLPLYGFTTSPIIAGERLVLQVGAKDMALAGFNLETGELDWKCGNDSISSQTPFRTKINERELVLAFGRSNLLGVDPRNGEIVFTYGHKAGNGSAVTPVPIGDHRFLLTLDDSFSKAIKLQPSGDSINVSEEWKQRSIKNTYNIPVLLDGNVYGFSTRILTCVDPDSGKPRWKSRVPGDGFLIAADQHVIVSTKKGSLHIARANSDKYDEVASAKVFKDLVWSIPAYSDNSIFQRSLGELARVDIVDRKVAIASKDTQTMPTGSRFSGLLEKIESAEGAKKQEFVDAFFKSNQDFPLVEGEVVQFLYSGKGNDVAVASDLFGARQERKMKQVAGTNLFYYSMKLEKDQRANYVFLVDYVPQVDPRNKRMHVSSVYAGEMEFAVRLRNDDPLKMSWFSMPDWKQPAYLPLPSKMAGQIEEKSISNEGSESKTRISVYLPPSYETAKDTKFPVAYFFGAGVRPQGKVDKIADSIYQKQKDAKEKLAPEAILVFVSPNPMAPPNPGLLSKVIVPFVDKNYRTRPNRDSRLCVGFGFDAASALMATAGNSDLIASVSVHSPMLFDAARTAVVQGMSKIEKPTSLHVEWGRYDMFNPHENWDLRTMSSNFVKDVQSNSKLEISGGMVNDAADWASWQNRIDKVLMLLDK